MQELNLLWYRYIIKKLNYLHVYKTKGKKKKQQKTSLYKIYVGTGMWRQARNLETFSRGTV